MFQRAYGAPPGMAIRGIESNALEEALPKTGFQMPLDWSPDGRFILFSTTGFPTMAVEDQSDIFVIDLQHGKKAIPLLSSKFHEGESVFSSDGNWVAFTSKPSGCMEIYLQRFQAGEHPGLTGERHLISHNGVRRMRWPRGDQEFYYVAGDRKMYSVPIRLEPTLSIGVPKPLFEISQQAMSALHSLFSFDVSADGRRFLVPAVTSGENSSIVIVKNWEGLVRLGH